MWELATILSSITVEEAMEIIEDATTNGFEFKVENHRIYFRE